MNNRWIPILILIAFAPVFLYVYSGGIPVSLMPQKNHPVATIEFQQPNMQQKMEPGAQFGIRSIEVKDGYIFNLLLDNGEWIEAHLTRATTEEAIPFVVEMFKKGSYPSRSTGRSIHSGTLHFGRSGLGQRSTQASRKSEAGKGRP